MRFLVVSLIALAPALASAQAFGTEEGPYSAVFRGVALSEALEEIVHLTDIDLVFNAELVSSHTAYCSRRRVPVEELLRCVLAGTGLDFVQSSSGAYVIILAPEQPARLARLAGRVVDAESGDPMPYAHVILADGGTVADRDGHFAFAGVMPGEHRLVATYVGYEATVLDSVWVEPGSRERVVVPLRAAPAELAPLVVDGLTQRLPSAGLGRLEAGAPGAAAAVAPTPDVMRGAAGTIGVSSAIPLADLHIQGGNTAEHVTRLDGVPVRDPVALGRYLGAFSPLAIREVTVHKAGFGVAHGSMIAGAIDVRHDLHTGRPGLAFQVDPVAANARASAPLGWPSGGGSVLVAFRQSIWDAYPDPGIGSLLRDANRIDPLSAGLWLGQPLREADIATVGNNPAVAFSDLHAAVNLRPDPFSTVRASVFRAGNYVAADHEALITYREQDHLAFFRDEYDWANWAGQAAYSRILGSRTTLAIRARASRHASSYVYDYGLGAQEPHRGELAPGTDRRSDSGHLLTEAALETEIGVSLGPGRDVEVGIAADLIDARFHGGNALIEPFVVEATEVHLSGYAQVRMALGTRTTIEGGARLTSLPSSGSFFAEPRAAVRYDGEATGIDGFALRLSTGLYRQFVNGFAFPSLGPAALVPELWFWLPTTPGTTPPRAVHAAAEALVLPARGWTIRAETYVRLESDLLTFDTPAFSGDSDLSPDPSSVGAPVNGRAIGAGVGLNWSAARGSVAASYSFERARRSTPRHSEPIAVPWEEPHRLSVDGRLRLGHGLSLEAAARGVWGRSWGLRRAYYEYVVDAGPPLSDHLSRPGDDRLPALLLADAQVAYRPQLSGTPLVLELGIANLFDRRNVFDWSLQTGGEPGLRLPRLLPGRRVVFAVRVDL